MFPQHPPFNGPPSGGPPNFPGPIPGGPHTGLPGPFPPAMMPPGPGPFAPFGMGPVQPMQPGMPFPQPPSAQPQFSGPPAPQQLQNVTNKVDSKFTSVAALLKNMDKGSHSQLPAMDAPSHARQPSASSVQSVNSSTPPGVPILRRHSTFHVSQRPEPGPVPTIATIANIAREAPPSASRVTGGNDRILCYTAKGTKIRVITSPDGMNALLEAHTATVCDIEVCPVDDVFASVDDQGTCLIWRAVREASGLVPHILAQLSVPPHSDGPSFGSPAVRIRWHPTSKTMLALVSGNSARVFELTDLSQSIRPKPGGLINANLVSTLGGHSARVLDFAFSPSPDSDAHYFNAAVTACADGALRLWNWSTGAALQHGPHSGAEWHPYEHGPVTRVFWPTADRVGFDSIDNDALVITAGGEAHSDPSGFGKGTQLKLWNTERWTELSSLHIRGRADGPSPAGEGFTVQQIDMDPSGSFVVVAWSEGSSNGLIAVHLRRIAIPSSPVEIALDVLESRFDYVSTVLLTHPILSMASWAENVAAPSADATDATVSEVRLFVTHSKPVIRYDLKAEQIWQPVAESSFLHEDPAELEHKSVHTRSGLSVVPASPTPLHPQGTLLTPGDLFRASSTSSIQVASLSGAVSSSAAAPAANRPTTPHTQSPTPAQPQTPQSAQSSPAPSPVTTGGKGRTLTEDAAKGSYHLTPSQILSTAPSPGSAPAQRFVEVCGVMVPVEHSADLTSDSVADPSEFKAAEPLRAEPRVLHMDPQPDTASASHAHSHSQGSHGKEGAPVAIISRGGSLDSLVSDASTDASAKAAKTSARKEAKAAPSSSAPAAAAGGPAAQSTSSGSTASQREKTENALMHRLDKLFTKHFSQVMTVMAAERKAHEAAEAKRLQDLLTAVSNTLHSTVPKQLESIVHKELENTVVPALTKNLQASIQTAVSKALTPIAQATMKDAVRDGVHTALSAAVKESTPLLAQSVGDQVADTLPEHVHTAFVKQLVPAVQESVKKMLTQIQAALTNTMEDRVSQLTQLERDQRDILTRLQSSQQQPQQNLERILQSLNDRVHDLASHRTLLDEHRELLASARSSLHEVKTAEPQQTPAEPPLTTEELGRLLAASHFEQAFVRALESGQLEMVLWLCSQLDACVLLSSDTHRLSQAVMLSLMQQLGFALNDETLLKLNWIREICIALDDKDPLIASHVGTVADEVVRNIDALLQGLPAQNATQQNAIFTAARTVKKLVQRFVSRS